MDGWMEWMDGWMDGWMEWMDGWMDEWMDGWINWVGGWGRWMDGWMDGWVDEFFGTIIANQSTLRPPPPTLIGCIRNANLHSCAPHQYYSKPVNMIKNILIA